MPKPPRRLEATIQTRAEKPPIDRPGSQVVSPGVHAPGQRILSNKATVTFPKRQVVSPRHTDDVRMSHLASYQPIQNRRTRC